MLEVFGMHGRAGLKPAIPRQKYASLKAFLFKRFNYLEINAFPLPPPRSFVAERCFRRDTVVRCRDFQREEPDISF